MPGTNDTSHADWDRLRAGLADAATEIRRHLGRRQRAAMARATDAAETAATVLATVDAAAEGRCACGCGAPITASSPSAYYASAACQARWMARHVDNPTEVYQRRDAATIGADGARIPLTAPDVPARLARFVNTRRMVYGPGHAPAEVAYRRTCPSCNATVEPAIYEVDDDRVEVSTFGRPDPVYITRPPMWDQECPRCGTAILGTVHIPVVYPLGSPAGWTLELHTGYGRVRTTVTRLSLAQIQGGRRAHVDRIWASMERDLARFEREWRGRLAVRAHHTGT